VPSKALMLRFIGVSRCPTVLLALCYSGLHSCAACFLLLGALRRHPDLSPCNQSVAQPAGDRRLPQRETAIIWRDLGMEEDLELVASEAG
jgi:hypothetical protein